MVIKYQKLIELSGVRNLSLRIIDLKENPNYEKMTAQLSSVVGLQLPSHRYEVIAVYVIDGVEVESYFNDRFPTFETAKAIVNKLETMTKDNNPQLQEWIFDEPLLTFLYTHRN